MLQNHLKTDLPSEWRNLFKHHESYPEDYYDGRSRIKLWRKENFSFKS